MSIENDIKQAAFRTSYHRLLVNIMYTSNWVADGQVRMLKPHGITLQQYNVLRILRGQYPNPVKVNDIMERMLDKMSNASRLVDKLLIKNLVARTECPSDRRAVDVVITEEGLTLLKTLDEGQARWEESMQQRLTEREANELSELLDKLRGSR